MKIEEAIKILKEIYTSKGIDGNNETIIKIRKEAIEVVLKELKNSIPKKKLKDKYKEISLKIEEYEAKREETHDFMGFYSKEISQLNSQLFLLQELLKE